MNENLARDPFLLGCSTSELQIIADSLMGNINLMAQKTQKTTRPCSGQFHRHIFDSSNQILL